MDKAQPWKPGDDRPKYYPETVVFALDACEDPGVDPNKHYGRFELLKQCICMFAQAKSRVNAHHKYGLVVIRDTVRWEGAGVTASPEGLAAALRGVQPAAPGGAGRPGGVPPPPPPPLELGSLLGLVQPLAVAEEADGGKVRVVLLYCRSTVPPVWTTHRHPGEGVAMDVLFIHDQAAAAAAAAAAGSEECASPQDVYTWFEDNVELLSARCGHNPYILEAGNPKRTVNLMVSLMAHPAQRPPLPSPPPDLAALPPQPTAAATTASSTLVPPPAAAPLSPLSTAAATSPPRHPAGATQSSLLYVPLGITAPLGPATASSSTSASSTAAAAAWPGRGGGGGSSAPPAWHEGLPAAAAAPLPGASLPLSYDTQPGIVGGFPASGGAALTTTVPAQGVTRGSVATRPPPDLMDLPLPQPHPLSPPPSQPPLPYRPLGTPLQPAAAPPLFAAAPSSGSPALPHMAVTHQQQSYQQHPYHQQQPYGQQQQPMLPSSSTATTAPTSAAGLAGGTATGFGNAWRSECWSAQPLQPPPTAGGGDGMLPHFYTSSSQRHHHQQQLLPQMQGQQQGPQASSQPPGYPEHHLRQQQHHGYHQEL